MPVLIICTYFALLLIPFAIGLIIGMEKSLQFKDVLKLNSITTVVLGAFSFAGLGLAYLFNNSDIKFMGAILILVAGFTTLNKGGKSNAFLFSVDVLNIKYYFFSNVAVGLSVMLATFGLKLFCPVTWQYPLLFIAFSFIICFLGIWFGKKIKTIKIIKISLLLSGIMLFLIGLIMFFLIWK
ncbi:MAG: hypothetical protein LBP67_08745 [Bacteroidales bacterium]|jgi:hypothetical protein|nr:hypothetical protein [Bacteroidales bacterium]